MGEQEWTCHAGCLLLEAEIGQGCMREQEWTCHAGCLLLEAEIGQGCMREQEWTCHACAGCVLLEGLGRGVRGSRNGLAMHVQDVYC